MGKECEFLGKFILELLKMGHSAGSLITEAIGLFKTFQKLTATKTFTVHFSKECLKMFSWAKNLIQVVISNFYMKKFSEMELLYLYNYVFPMFLISFIILLSSSYRYYIHLLISLVFATIGFSLGYIQENINILKIFGSIAFVILIIIIIVIFCKEDHLEYLYIDEFHSGSRLTFTFSLFNSLLVATIMLIPFLMRSLYFIGSLMFVIEIIVGASFLVEFIIATCLRKREQELKKKSEEEEGKENQEYVYQYNIYFIPIVLALFFNFFSLLIIPCTEHFVEVMKSGLNLKYNWQIIIGYIVIGIVLPVLMTLFLIICEYSDYTSKYKKDKDGYVYFELVDIGRQIAYAIVAAYDIPIACICIEIAWILAFIIPRPYKNLSDYFLQGGSSFIVIISNVIAIVCNYKNTGFLSFNWCLALVIVACLPAVISLYVFFAADFRYEEADSDSSSYGVDKEEATYFLSLYFKVAMPFVCLFFGMFLAVYASRVSNETYQRIYI